MRRRLGVVAALFVVAALAVPAFAQNPAPAPPAPVTVVKTVKIKPKNARVRVKFTPAAAPSIAQVHRIIGLESRRWGVSSEALRRRVRCESTFNYAEVYTGHYGLLQFLPETWGRGVSTMTRPVGFTRSRVVKRRSWRVTRFSDGHRTVKRGPMVKVRRTWVYHGMLPRNPGIFHGWAQLRIGAQAMAGRSAVGDGEWACR